MVAGVSESIKNINWVSDEAREVKKKLNKYVSITQIAAQDLSEYVTIDESFACKTNYRHTPKDSGFSVSI